MSQPTPEVLSLTATTPAPGSSAHRFFCDARIRQRLPTFGGVAAPDEQIYLDFAAATPVEASVVLETLAWQTEAFGNPSNRLHRMGEYAEHALMDARRRMASALGAFPETQVIFTSSATEANNLALRGLVLHPKRKRRRLVFSPTEHSSVTETIRALEKLPLKAPIEAVSLRVDAQGQIDLDHAQSVITEDTLVVSIMDINNETGVKQSRLKELIAWTQRQGAVFHCDAVQGFARHGFRIDETPAHLAVVSSGKIYGPRGVAALCVTGAFPDGSGSPLRLSPQLTGGGQEMGLRSSTSNLAAVRGFALAAEHLNATRQEQRAHYEALEKHFLRTLSDDWGNAFAVHGAQNRIPGLMMLSLEGVNSMKLIELCKDLCVSAGSACRTLQATASPVLLAMGVPLEEALGSFRVSVGLPTTLDDVEKAAHILSAAAHRMA